jgi:nucleoside-triphosphatase
MAESVRLILTGETGCGKTRMCKAVADGLRDRGWRVAGVLSPGVWTRDQKLAIEALDLRSGEVRRLAERAGSGRDAEGPATRGWHFHAATLAWCNLLLANAGDADLLVVDELGPLEFERNEGLMRGLQAVDAGSFRMGLLVVRPELLHLARARWADARGLALQDAGEVSARAHEVLNLAVSLDAPDPGGWQASGG